MNIFVRLLDLEDIAVWNLNVESNADIEFALGDGATGGFVSIPSTVLVSANQANAAMSIINYQKDTLFYNQGNITMVSSVVSVNVQGIETGKPLLQPVQMGFRVPKAETLSRFTCVFYNFAELAWQTTGCEINMTLSSDGQVVCSCKHLTNFAVLLDFNGNSQGLSTSDRVALEYITSVGCSISIVLMSIVVLVFIFYPVWSHVHSFGNF